MKGEVRIEQLLEEDSIFEAGQSVWVGKFKTEIESFRHQHGRCVAKFKGIDDISEAERYVGCDVQIPADELPETEEGWFYTFDLKGCRVYAADGEYLGEVTDVLFGTGTEILMVEQDQKEMMIPFAQEYLQSIELDQRKIVVNLPEGLRDLNK